jgi:hypothetical protein
MSAIAYSEQQAIDIESIILTEEPTELVLEAIREYEKETELLTSFDDSPDSDWSQLADQVVGHEQEV